MHVNSGGGAFWPDEHRKVMTDAQLGLDLPIRRAKLRQPPLGKNLVLRPRLTSHLDRCLETPLTLVAAPAGFGKTTLLSEWAAGQATPTAWLTADATDRDLARFVGYVVAAIETVAPGAGDPVLALLQRLHPVPAAEVGASLADELLDLTHDVVLVVDDFHLANSADVELFLGGLLRCCHRRSTSCCRPAPIQRSHWPDCVCRTR